MGPGGGPDVVIFDLPGLDDLKLLFDRDAGWATDVRTTERELQNEWRLLRDAPSGLQMSVPTASLEHVQLRWEFTKKFELLFEKIRVLQNMVGIKQAARAVVEEELMKLKGSVFASDELPERLAESDKALKTARTEVTSLDKK